MLQVFVSLTIKHIQHVSPSLCLAPPPSPTAPLCLTLCRTETFTVSLTVSQVLCVVEVTPVKAEGQPRVHRGSPSHRSSSSPLATPSLPAPLMAYEVPEVLECISAAGGGDDAVQQVVEVVMESLQAASTDAKAAAAAMVGSYWIQAV
jgi:hypothetical protein